MLLTSSLTLISLVLSSLQPVLADSYPELVIDIPEAEANRLVEKDPVYGLIYARYSWLAQGRIRIAKLDSNVLALVGQLVQFTPFPDAEPIILLSHGIQDTTWRASRLEEQLESADAQDIAIFAQDAPDLDIAEAGRLLDEYVAMHNEVTLKILAIDQDPNTGDPWYAATGTISTYGMGPMSPPVPPDNNVYRISGLPSLPGYVVLFEIIRQWPSMPICPDMRSPAAIAAWERSPEIVAYRKTDAYLAQQEAMASYKAMMVDSRQRVYDTCLKRQAEMSPDMGGCVSYVKGYDARNAAQ